MTTVDGVGRDAVSVFINVHARLFAASNTLQSFFSQWSASEKKRGAPSETEGGRQMTGIVVVPAGDAIVFATDGAIYDPATGFLIGSCSKVVLIPECSCVITQRGAVGFAQAVHTRLGPRTDYDDILRDVAQASNDVAAEFESHYGAAPFTFGA